MEAKWSTSGGEQSCDEFVISGIYSVFGMFRHVRQQPLTSSQPEVMPALRRQNKWRTHESRSGTISRHSPTAANFYPFKLKCEKQKGRR